MAEAAEHITCQELVEEASDYLEGALSSDDAELFEHHLNYCAGCERYVDEMRSTVGTAGRLREDEAPNQTIEFLLDAFKDRRSE